MERQTWQLLLNFTFWRALNIELWPYSLVQPTLVYYQPDPPISPIQIWLNSPGHHKLMLPVFELIRLINVDLEEVVSIQWN